jgi:hypothetical protein
MQFKKLELSTNRNWFQRTISSRHFKKSLVYILVGALAGFVIYYFSEGRYIVDIAASDYISSILLGGFFGFFVTNSPCARGRC